MVLRDSSLQNRQTIVSVGDDEVGSEGEERAILAEVSDTHGVEGSQEQFGNRRGAEERAQSVLHLEGSLVGEGDDTGGFKEVLDRISETDAEEH